MLTRYTFKRNRWTIHIASVVLWLACSPRVDRGFEPQLGQTKDFKIDICCFSAERAALRSKSKDWLDRNQDNVSEWSDIFTRGLFFQRASTMNIQFSVLVYYKADLVIISLTINLFSPWHSWKIAELALITRWLTEPFLRSHSFYFLFFKHK